MLSFNQYLNESKKSEFESIEVGDTVQWAGSTKKVTKVDDGVIHIGKTKVNKAMWRQRDGKVIKDDEK
jgi:hypothetical protein